MLKVIDIGHKNYGLDSAIAALEAEVSKMIYNGESKAMKIIHGHGTGVLKDAVREWCAGQSGRFKAVIFGEDYDMFHQDSMSMRSACGLPYDEDFGRQNSAVTYIWLG